MTVGITIAFVIGWVGASILAYLIVHGDSDKHEYEVRRLKSEVYQERHWKEHDRALAEDYKLKFESAQRRVNTLEHEIETIDHMRNVADQMRNRRTL